jgi:hypothetical protein
VVYLKVWQERNPENIACKRTIFERNNGGLCPIQGMEGGFAGKNDP